MPKYYMERSIEILIASRTIALEQTTGQHHAMQLCMCTEGGPAPCTATALLDGLSSIIPADSSAAAAFSFCRDGHEASQGYAANLVM